VSERYANGHPGHLAAIAPYTFKPGQSGNPGGKPAGARNRLQGKFLNALADDFETHGKKAIEACRESDPSAYLRAIVALMPRELEITRPLDDLTDEQLEAALATVRALEAAASAGAGEGAAPSVQPAPGVSALPEAG
jgi:hypothetical protein